MPEYIPPTEQAEVVKFGGGVNSRASVEDINPRECTEGKNFELDLKDLTFKNRKPFDLVATATNTSEIRGFACLQKQDGTIKVLVQAGTAVYDWDGASTFTSKGTVSATAKLRGPLTQNSTLDNKVIITDLNLQEAVKEYDGTTFQSATFTKNDGSTAWTGNFKAKYCVVDNERAIFANIDDNGAAFPHLIVGSKRSDYTVLSNDQRPSSALNDEDPFFLIQPDLRPINGMAQGFGRIVTSSREGPIYELTGATAKDFSFEPLHARSGASGDEAIVNIGNDIMYGRQGRMESLFGTERFGDVETNDLTLHISDQIETYKDWLVAYNSRNQRVYCIADSTSEAWVLHKPIMGTEVSPWSNWTTAHTSSFQPTAMMSFLDPQDGLEYVFFGDSSGNIYRMEGSGSSGDGGTNPVEVSRTSRLVVAPLEAEVYDIEGWIKYKSLSSVTVNIEIQYQGYEISTQAFEVEITPNTTTPVFGGGYYFNNGVYFGTFSGKLTRQPFDVAGRGSEFQVKVSVTDNDNFEIHEIGLRYAASS